MKCIDQRTRTRPFLCVFVYWFNANLVQSTYLNEALSVNVRLEKQMKINFAVRIELERFIFHLNEMLMDFDNPQTYIHLFRHAYGDMPKREEKTRNVTVMKLQFSSYFCKLDFRRTNWFEKHTHMLNVRRVGITSFPWCCEIDRNWKTIVINVYRLEWTEHEKWIQLDGKWHGTRICNCVTVDFIISSIRYAPMRRLCEKCYKFLTQSVKPSLTSRRLHINEAKTLLFETISMESEQFCGINWKIYT